ncbi:hypothetical protein D1632_06025 [Chryseobacterium nematophagum]|uniref:Peptidase C1A papain C-terminal domain-containing protein n=1 Tax=Chryseobacterium nematophagum TaxID=2305228 RepID=A0A3M7LAY4_9FLAO|nr:C1 family peptidase [Chryseobacterium nematophagum]RMZ59204.1 hypothetical protein D1632_06025 [Chryseobacterium nematophagum]
MKKTIFLAITGLVMTTVTSCNQDRDENQSSLSTTQSGMYSRPSHDHSVDPIALKDMYKAPLNRSYIIPNLPPIGNQGTEQSCVAWATAYAATTILERNFFNDPYRVERSPRFIYNQINKFTPTPKIIDGLNKLVEVGACSIEEMPYREGESNIPISPTQINLASSHKLTKWATVDLKNKTLVKTLLANNFPIIISVPTMLDPMGKIKAPDWTVTYCPVYDVFNANRHAVCVVGYDDVKGAYKVMNSYGKTYGDEGFFWISYNVFHGPTDKSPGAFLVEGYTAEVKRNTLPTK